MTEFGEGENFDMPTFLVSPVVQHVIISHVSVCPQEIGQQTLKASVGSAFLKKFSPLFPLCLGFFEGLLWAYLINSCVYK